MPEWMSSRLPEWVSGWHLVLFSVALAMTMAALSAALVAVVLIRLPADYFVNPESRARNVARHPVTHVLLILGRNLLGYVLVVLGVLLSLPGVPGQGVLTILMGVMLIDLPGKDRAARWLVTRRPVLAAVNRMRARVGREPLQVEESRSSDRG